MTDFFKRMANDRWFGYILGITAYLFLVLVLLYSQRRATTVAQIMFLLAVFLLVVRLAYIAAVRKPAKRFAAVKSLIRTTYTVGFLAMLAVILGPGFELSWLIYCLIGIAVAGEAIYAAVKKSKGSEASAEVV